MKINVRPVAPKPIPATELKAGDKFTVPGTGRCVYTRLNTPIGGLASAMTDTWGPCSLSPVQLVYRYPAEPATTTVGELVTGDLFQKPDNPHVFMAGDSFEAGGRICMVLRGNNMPPGTLVCPNTGDAVIKVEVVE